MSTKTQQRLSENMRAQRREHGLSKVDFCLLTGISRPLLDLIENGNANLKLTNLERIADSLGLEPWQLLR